MKVTQEGGKFIPVIDGNELDLQEQLERKAEYDMYIYNRDNGYSGFDEFHYEQADELRDSMREDGIYDHE
jgi:hypothetical protein